MSTSIPLSKNLPSRPIVGREKLLTLAIVVKTLRRVVEKHGDQIGLCEKTATIHGQRVNLIPTELHHLAEAEKIMADTVEVNA